MPAVSVDRSVGPAPPPPPPAPPPPPGSAAPPAWRRPLLVAAGLAAATASVVVRDPSRHAVFPPCPFRAITGLDCPLCGGTRAVGALAHLDVAGGASQNLVVTALAPLAAVAVVVWLALSFAPERASAVLARLPRAATVVTWTALAFVAFGVVRVLPIDQLRWLRSG